MLIWLDIVINSRGIHGGNNHENDAMFVHFIILVHGAGLATEHSTDQDLIKECFIERP